MRTLVKLARYTDWANQVVFGACEQALPQVLQETAPGTVGSIDDTLKHLVSVENAYLAMLQGRDPGEALGPRNEYFAHDLAWFADHSRQLDAAYLALLDGKDESWLEGPLRVPWFDHPMTRRDGLLQVFTHSAQHRAQVLSELGAHGVKVPDVDYMLLLEVEE